MAYKYSFDPIVANEYEKAFDWYEEKSSIAADGLIDESRKLITITSLYHHKRDPKGKYKKRKPGEK